MENILQMGKYMVKYTPNILQNIMGKSTPNIPNHQPETYVQLLGKNKSHGPNHQPDLYPVTHSCFELIPVS